MNDSALQLLVLAGVAVFLILKLRNILGTREGFEKPPLPRDAKEKLRQSFEIIEGGPDHDIVDHVEADSATAKALAAMKAVEPDFSVGSFLEGARGAYEMILMGFERGDLDSIEPFLSEAVFQTFVSVVSEREDNGLTIEAEFAGIREMAIDSAEFDRASGEGEISVRFIGELTSVVRDRGGDIIEGDKDTVKRQRDVWTFARAMGANNPNWKLVATGG